MEKLVNEKVCYLEYQAVTLSEGKRGVKWQQIITLECDWLWVITADNATSRPYQMDL